MRKEAAQVQEEKDDLGIELIDLEHAGDGPEGKETHDNIQVKEPFNLVKEILSLLGTMAIAVHGATNSRV